MSIVSVNDITRFTPRDYCDDDGTPKKGAPVYLIQPGDGLAKSRWRRDVIAAGAQFASNGALMETLRRGVKDVVVEQQQAKFLSMIDAWEEAVRTLEDLEQSATATPAEIKDASDHIKALSGPFNHFEEQMLAYPPYALKLAARQFWVEVAPQVAAQHFLIGWENVDVPFERRNSLVPSVTTAALEYAYPGHVAAIGWVAIGLNAATKADEKNFDGASASAASRKPTRTSRKAPGTASARN